MTTLEHSHTTSLRVPPLGKVRGIPAATEHRKALPAKSDKAAPASPLDELLAYQRDVWERSVLFLDTLRQRADDLLAHARAGKPPLLDFDYELITDARHYERPANYALLRITRQGDTCLADCLDPEKPPVIVVDPRAGHGPGIGGFKQESEIGIALREGHPVYFVMFYPEPCPGQTLADVLHALRRFVDEVARRHPGNPPVLYGNCQAGWAVTILAAHCQGLTGPTVLNGSPLSYWAGESDVNPMRIAGGLLGGAWLAHLAADLADGRFDGAWLVQNFENLRPESVWQKYVDLFSHIDSERERFLAFERWLGSFYFLSREEILAIVDNLFIGDRLEHGTLPVCHGCVADLRQIHNPVVIFASYGDNITPPHQALGWIPIVYRDTDDLQRAGQRIVYLINQHVGHLGLFVSAAVAKREHRAILQSLDKFDTLAPGLYEMKIDDRNTDENGEPSVHFEERKVEDIRFPIDPVAFQRVKAISETIDNAYTRIFSNWIQMTASPASAAMLEWMHPMRTSRMMFGSSGNPLMSVTAGLAAAIRRDRHPVADDDRLKQAEFEAFKVIADMLASGRKLRDHALEKMFERLYGAHGRQDVTTKG